MVCENRRLRSLLVRRRGGFLEDPFFRDAWGDYNNAVRRIVDRFNHGMFTPTERLRDTHYHSMYRTLRSARINYAAQAARFKDEGEFYKLVMDVREFLGGEITVRTAGGTLSVRGRLESGVGGDGDSAYSGTSRASSSAHTLHRRFNLPPDADGEKVQSTLSRDTILTVTIGKRTDVRVIPVTVEGETPLASASGRSGTKRHSVTQPEQGPTPSKRSQDNHHDTEGRGTRDTKYQRDRSTSRSREPFGMGRSKEDQRGRANDKQLRTDEEAARGNGRESRRCSELYTRSGSLKDSDDDRRKSYPDSSTRKTAEEISQRYLGSKVEDNGSRRRTRETVEEEPEAGQRNRRRISKYEEAKEFHIPIRFENSNDSDIVFQYPATSNEKVPSSGDKGTSVVHKGEMESSMSLKYNKDTEGIPYSSSLITKMEREKQNISEQVKNMESLVKNTSNIRNHSANEKENIKPSKEEDSWVYSKLYQNDSEMDNMEKQLPTINKETTATDEKKRYYFGDTPLAAINNQEVEVRVVSPEGASAREQGSNQPMRKTEDISSEIYCDKDKELWKTGDKANKEKQTMKKEDSNTQEGYLRTESQESDSVETGSKSPLEGREVTVEKKQSDMEGDMFKDCWQNFSSTLQEVLSRLQELSSELGPPRSQATPSTSSKPKEISESMAAKSTQETSADYKPHSDLISKVPKSETENGEISEYQDHVSIDGNEWVAGDTEAERGVGRTLTPTTPPTVYAGFGSPRRSNDKDREEEEVETEEEGEEEEGEGARYMDDEASVVREGSCEVQSNVFESHHGDKEKDSPLMQQVTGQNVAPESVIEVPCRSSGNSDSEGDGGAHHAGGARTRGSMIAAAVTTNAATAAAVVAGRPASICGPIRHNIPMNFILDGSNLHRNGTAPFDTSHSPTRRPRPTSLNVTEESALLKDLRKSSPVDALKDRFLRRRVTPTSESSPLSSCCDTDNIHYIPVELEASKRVTLTSKREEKTPSPTSSSAASTPCTPAATLPLCERRGRGVENLVIVEDNPSSNVSSQTSTSGTFEENTSETASSESSYRWTGDLAHKPVSGNSSGSTAGYGSFQHPQQQQQQQQHSSSSSRRAESRKPQSHFDGIGGSVVGQGGTDSKTCPRVSSPSPSPSVSVSESEPDVDEIISQAERVIEETKRLSASVTNDLPVENDLGREKINEFKSEKVKERLHPLSGFNLAPNIDTRTSPESNFLVLEEEEEEEGGDKKEGDRKHRGEEEEAESVVEGCLTIPLPGLAGRPQHPRYTPPSDLQHTAHPTPTVGKQAARKDSVIIEDVDDDDDVIGCEEVRPTIVTSPEIQSSDVMGCARENGRGRDGGVVVPPGPRDMPPSHTLTQETQHTRATRQAAAAVAAATARDSSMGGVFSRGRTHDSASRHTPTQNVSGVTGRGQAASPTPRSPTTPTRRERTISTEESPLPPYVRQKPEPTKRYSGFGHVQSDNVRKMRDVWGSRREPQPPPTPPKPSRVPASPPPVPRRREAQSPRRGPDSPRRFSDTAKHRTESPSRGPDSPRRVHDYSPRRGSEASSRRGPDSPKRGPDSPKRSFFSRDSPTRDSGRSKNNNNNFYSSTISSRNKTSSSPRRGSTSSTEGAPSPSTATTTQQPSTARTSSTPANSSRPQPDKYRPGGWPGSKGSPGRTSRRTSTPPPPTTKAPPPPSTSVPPPPASPFHHKVFRRLRDATLQPDSETISFTEEDDRYKLVMDVEEYVPGEIEVLQDDKELTVKGRIDTTHRGNTTTRTFHRKFHIPNNTREEDIDSALSKDGILTVYVPKKRERVIKIELTD